MTTFMRKYSLHGVLYRTCFTLAAALACACVPLQLTAADYYVSQTGDDAKDGSQAAPFKTILHAVKAAGAGDTVHLVPGDQPWRESVALNTHPTWYHKGGEPGNAAPDLFAGNGDPKLTALAAELEALDVNTLTPIAALAKLNELKKKLE